MCKIFEGRPRSSECELRKVNDLRSRRPGLIVLPSHDWKTVENLWPDRSDLLWAGSAARAGNDLWFAV